MDPKEKLKKLYESSDEDVRNSIFTDVLERMAGTEAYVLVKMYQEMEVEGI